MSRIGKKPIKLPTNININFLACKFVKIPFEVEIIAIPKPFKTLGKFFDFT
jgi:hypothetical protein